MFIKIEKKSDIRIDSKPQITRPTFFINLNHVTFAEYSADSIALHFGVESWLVLDFQGESMGEYHRMRRLIENATVS